MNREEGRVDVSRSSKQRALGDLTNIAGNRGVSKLTGKFIIGNRIRKSIENFKTEASRSSKRVCKGSEDLFIAKENTSVIKNFTNLDSISSSSMSTEDWHMKCLSDPKRKPILPVSTDNKEPKKTKLLSNSLNPGLHFITGTSSSRGDTQEGTCVRDSYISGIKKPCHSEKGKNICSTPDGNIGMDERNTTHNANVMQNVADVDCGQRPLTVGLNRCSGQDCSCLLCTKASYIWTNLLYQDAKGRLAEVKKSRRQVSILVGKSYIRDVPANENIPDNFKEFTKLEYDLMTRWRSLFLNTENILVCEGTKLQEDIARFKKVRENCKKDMERFSGASSSNLQMPFDDSDG